MGGKAVEAPFWYDHDFTPIVRNTVKAARKMVKLRFCQKRVLEVVRHSHDGEMELVPLAHALECLPQLEHKGHESCTSKSCEHAIKDFTSVTQLHKCPAPEGCKPSTSEMFNQSLVVEVLKGYTEEISWELLGSTAYKLANSMTTAWTLDGMSLVDRNVSYLAVSHVWSDGTGSGAWGAGQVNECLWDSWVGIARQLGCNAVWWDTVCVPRDKAARSIALRRMHKIYEDAEYTVVHDLYLAGIEWKDDGSPCIALVLSPWFTRGWTALELLLSYKIFVLFRQGDGYTLKNLDTEVLAKHRFLDSHAHWIATEAVKRLRPPPGPRELKSAYEILSVLQARHTSWQQDVKAIAELMCGLGPYGLLSKDYAISSEEEVTKKILRKLRTTLINPNCLLHGLPTMSEPQFSWCPHRFVDIPSGKILQKASLRINENGTLDGNLEIWVIPSEIHGVIWPLNKDKNVSIQVQSTLLQKPEECVILTCW